MLIQNQLTCKEIKEGLYLLYAKKILPLFIYFIVFLSILSVVSSPVHFFSDENGLVQFFVTVIPPFLILIVLYIPSRWFFYFCSKKKFSENKVVSYKIECETLEIISEIGTFSYPFNNIRKIKGKKVVVFLLTKTQFAILSKRYLN